MNEEICRNCKNKLILTLTPHSVHYGRLDCKWCGFMGWGRNPNSQKIGTTSELRIGKKSIEEVCLFHGFENPFCFMCLRNKSQLGFAETLTIDHILELNKGGEDVVENMQILCSACHKMKNWLRLYINWHLNKEGEKVNEP